MKHIGKMLIEHIAHGKQQTPHQKQRSNEPKGYYKPFLGKSSFLGHDSNNWFGYSKIVIITENII
jgi:hypothetical protein